VPTMVEVGIVSTLREVMNPRLFSRNRILLNQTYPELVQPLAMQALDSYIADGEIVAFKGDVASFSQLQRRMLVRNPEICASDPMLWGGWKVPPLQTLP
jgi:hypothetical protein